MVFPSVALLRLGLATKNSSFLIEWCVSLALSPNKHDAMFDAEVILKHDLGHPLRATSNNCALRVLLPVDCALSSPAPIPTPFY
jgi:hypothetical protein